MKIKNPLDLAKEIEEKSGHFCWRQSFVLPADLSKTKKKEYHWEFPGMTEEQLENGKLSSGGRFTFPGRGWGSVDDIPNFMKKDKEAVFANVYSATSIYLKYVPDLYVVDFDDGNHDAGVDEKGDPINPFYKFCVDQSTIIVQTNKGYHFYFWIPGCPDFTCSTKIQSEECFGDVDLLGRKAPNFFNVVEANHHEVFGGDEGIGSISSVPWDTMKEFLNVDRMMGKDRKTDNQTIKEKNETKAICQEGSGLPKKQFLGYLDRLRKTDHPSQMDLRSRWHYEDFVKIGMICKNNFKSDEDGFQIWFNWTKEDPDYDDENHDHSGRNLQYMMSKWESFKEVPNPLTWKELRRMVNHDDPHQNPYQEIYDQTGISGMVEYMNGFLMLNVATGEILYENPNETKIYDNTLNIYTPAVALPIFEKYMVKIVDPQTDKVSFKNPFSLWKKNIGRRDVHRMVFDPKPTAPKDVYNFFGGFDVSPLHVSDLTEKEAMETCRHLLDHIYHIWCKGSQELYDYIMNWFAFILQKPWIKIGVLLAVKSREGAGKGIVFDFMRHILGGRLYAQINSLDQLIGSHNSVLEGRLLINGDEIIWGGNIKDGNAMKAVITETEVWIHEKYRARYKIQNTTAIAIASNEDRALSSREGDRRSMGTELANTWAGRQKTPEHRAYFENISGTRHQGIARPKYEAFAKVLYERDMSNFNPQDAPITELLTDQMERNYTPLQKFWKGVLDRGCFQIEDKHKKDTREKYFESGYENQKIEKSRFVKYDDSQLIWGNVSPKFGNGDKEFDWVYEKTKIPILGYAFALHGEAIKDYWKQYLKHLKETEEYVFPDDCHLKDIPIPEFFVEVATKKRGGYRDKSKMEEGWSSYSWQKNPGGVCGQQHDGSDMFWNKKIPYTPNIKENDKETYEDALPWGMRTEHLQPPKSDLGDHWAPTILRAKNVGGDTDYPGWHFDNRMISWHNEQLENMTWQNVWEMQDNDHLHTGFSQDYGCGRWEHAPKDYLRKCEKWFEWSEDYGQYKDWDHNTDLTDEGRLVMKSYLDKWVGGVNPSNFKDDLVGRRWFGEDGEQLFLHQRKEKIVKWHYNKSWVYSRYKESAGIGYGQDNIDEGTFWKGIKEMMGDTYRSIRLKDQSKDGGGVYRGTAWKFVKLEKCREMFQKWTGRLVEWDDGEEDDEEMPNHWF
tara:strand:+ start:531 stop:4064 length:3534 start_codon:yes stop_codon:yes gene_type:complete